MVHVASRTAARIAGCAILLAVAAPAKAQLPAGSAAASEAYGIGASFTSLNMTTEVAPVPDAAGSAPPPYDIVKSRVAFSQTIAVPPLVPAAEGPPVAAEFTATATGLRSEAASKGIQLDFVEATGNAKVASADLRIVSGTPPGTTTPVKIYLNVTASKVAATATYSEVVPQSPKVSGAASFGALAIGGSLLGGETVSYSGSAPPNTVLFQSATVTITAHQQIVVGLISCSPNCTFTPSRIIVRALDINLNNAEINGFKVTGDIVLGDAAAQ